MASLLIVTADPEVLNKIEQAALDLQYRVKSVPSIASAQEWLGRQPFDAILVDSRYGAGVPVQLLELAWRQNSRIFGGIFNFRGKVEDEAEARFFGAHVFSDEHALEAIIESLIRVRELEKNSQEFPILVVEDLDSPRDIICSYIEALGFKNVTGVGNAQDALNTLLSVPELYACVVTDINMPRVSGITLLKEIRSLGSLKHLPVIMLTAYASPENLLECVREGASGFIVKPPTKKIVLKELEKARRMFFGKQSPRLCKAEEAHLLEAALQSIANLS